MKDGGSCVHVICRVRGNTVAIAAPRDAVGAVVACNTNMGEMRNLLRDEIGVPRKANFVLGDTAHYVNVAQFPARMEAWCVLCRAMHSIDASPLAAKVEQVRVSGRDAKMRV